MDLNRILDGKVGGRSKTQGGKFRFSYTDWFVKLQLAWCFSKGICHYITALVSKQFMLTLERKTISSQETQSRSHLCNCFMFIPPALVLYSTLPYIRARFLYTDDCFLTREKSPVTCFTLATKLAKGQVVNPARGCCCRFCRSVCISLSSHRFMLPYFFLFLSPPTALHDRGHSHQLTLNG